MFLPKQCTVVEATKKKGRGRMWKESTRDDIAVNESLTYSDFLKRQQVLQFEAEVTVHLGGLIGVKTIGSEEAIIQDISKIIERRGNLR
ncbi:hypothetical protein V6N12_069005 [Hibiscus sabdariffa]|uniref:Uncharacterized protein n=1 Tax=Hibiscus sabdariffa TaxID=183260 RepID=A0ABR2CAE3_9ROSI